MNENQTTTTNASGFILESLKLYSVPWMARRDSWGHWEILSADNHTILEDLSESLACLLCAAVNAYAKGQTK